MEEKEKAQLKSYLRGDIISLIFRKFRITVVRDAVELVPPTAIILYLEKRDL